MHTDLTKASNDLRERKVYAYIIYVCISIYQSINLSIYLSLYIYI